MTFPVLIYLHSADILCTESVAPVIEGAYLGERCMRVDFLFFGY